MRKVILQEIVTLDGYAAGPNGDVGFIPASTKGDPRWGAEQSALMDRVDTLRYPLRERFWIDGRIARIGEAVVGCRYPECLICIGKTLIVNRRLPAARKAASIFMEL